MVTSSEVTVDESNSKVLSSFEKLTDKLLSLVLSSKTDEESEVVSEPTV